MAGCAAVLGAAVPAVGHYGSFTGSVYQDRFIPTNAQRCILQSGGGCSNHSWTFISSKDVGTSGSTTITCPRIYGSFPGSWSGGSCNPGLVRYCLSGYRHSSSHLDCHDQDVYDWYVAGAAAGPPGSVIQMHGGY